MGHLRMQKMDFNFIKSSREDADKELFFAPINDEDKFFKIEDNMNMANIIFIAGILPSVSQARKNGWNKPIPNGFTDIRVGKNKTRITILNEVNFE
jgi:hypothetical protein